MEGMNPGMAMGGAPATELMMVPDKMVGLIIGRGGEQITRLQAESGCKIQMAQDSQGNLDYKTLILKVALSRKILENFYISKIKIPNHYPEQKI